ncbi:MAG: 16S rRNA processing protein RimM [Chloroflexi bacterium]|nr:16S rRNA processing protein RimM [Chloroflexota bacterium]
MTVSKSPAAAGPGSPSRGEPVHLAVGFLRRPHGVRGEILMDVLTDFPERLQPGMQVYVGEEHAPMTLVARRGHAKGLLITFEGIESREAVGNFRNQYVYVLTADRPPLPEGEYYHHQLIGLQVVSEDDRLLGELTTILETGANDVYVVKSESGREILLPAIPAVVLDVDLGRGQMRVHLLPGLLDEGAEG